MCDEARKGLVIFQTAKLKGGDQPTYHSAGLWYLCVDVCVCVFKGLDVLDRMPEELWMCVCVCVCVFEGLIRCGRQNA